MQEQPAAERRRVQRIRLDQPVRATAGGVPAFVLDLSTRGFRIAHREPIAKMGDTCTLTFEWEGRHVGFRCVVKRTILQRTSESTFARNVYHSGVEIVHCSEPARETLETIVAHHIALAIDEQKANARGIPPMAVRAFDSKRTAKLVRHEYAGGRWNSLPSNDPTQPRNGFTISADAKPAEVEMLRRTWERSDAAGREWLQITAELSIGPGDATPARRYDP